jgi:hypothetical protein
MMGIKQILSDILGRKSRLIWNNDSDIRVYFQNEYKNEAQHAYEYWLSTGKIGYSSR